MKIGFAAFCLSSLITVQLLAGPETIIRERAKELRDQNNVRQGVPPPAPPAQRPAQPAPTTAHPATATAQPAGFGRLQTTLAAIRPASQVTATQKQLLTQDLLATAQGTKPSPTLAAKLADHLAVALAEKTIPAADRSRLAQDLQGALNPGSMQTAQLQAIAADAQATLQKNGVSRNNAVAIANDLKELATELQKPAAK